MVLAFGMRANPSESVFLDRSPIARMTSRVPAVGARRARWRDYSRGLQNAIEARGANTLECRDSEARSTHGRFERTCARSDWDALNRARDPDDLSADAR